MTPLVLLDALKTFIERETGDLLLPVKVDRDSGKAKERAAEVHLMRLPNKEAETKQIPYVLLQFLKQKDAQSSGQSPESECMVRIVAAVYSENGEEGAMGVLNLLTRIRMALLREGILTRQFLLRPELELVVYPDSTPPYYLGEMVSTWEMPSMEREVQNVWQ